MEIELSDGRTLNIDLTKITIGEYRALFNREQDQGEEDATIGKVVGLTAVEVVDLPFPDYRALTKAFFKACSDVNTDQKN